MPLPFHLSAVALFLLVSNLLASSVCYASPSTCVRFAPHSGSTVLTATTTCSRSNGAGNYLSLSTASASASARNLPPAAYRETTFTCVGRSGSIVHVAVPLQVRSAGTLSSSTICANFPKNFPPPKVTVRAARWVKTMNGLNDVSRCARDMGFPIDSAMFVCQAECQVHILTRAASDLRVELDGIVAPRRQTDGSRLDVFTVSAGLHHVAWFVARRPWRAAAHHPLSQRQPWCFRSKPSAGNGFRSHRQVRMELVLGRIHVFACGCEGIRMGVARGNRRACVRVGGRGYMYILRLAV